MKFLTHILLTLIITLTSLNVSAVNCDAYSTWTTGGQTANGFVKYGGILYQNNNSNGWDSHATNDNPVNNNASSGGEWTTIGVCGTDPVVTTQNESAVTSSTMTFNGTVTNDGGVPPLTDRGFIYGTVADDVTNSDIGSLVGDSKVVSEGGTTVSTYSYNITGLCPGITYYYKAYASNSTGTGYDGTNNTAITNTPGTFTTVQNGAFSSASTWGGCGAPDLTLGHTINIGHTVTASGMTVTEGTDIVVTNGGTLTNTGTITLGGTGSIATITVDNGGTVTTTNVGYTSAGIVNNNGTFNITNTLTISSFATFNTAGTGTIGNIVNGAGDFNQTAGTIELTNNYDCANDCDFTQTGGIFNVGGDFKVWGSGESHVDGDIDVTGTLIMLNNGYLDGTGVVTFVSKNINPDNSGAYVGCVDLTKWDDNVGTPTWFEISSPWDLTDCAVVLPIELLYFKANVQDNGIIYSWQTASEINNDYFELLVSKDINDWKVIDVVNGAGNSFSILNYYSYSNELDYSYAKLRQTDYDGQYVDSYIIALDKINAYTHDNLLEVIGDKVIVRTMNDISMNFNIYSINGQVLYTKLINNSQVIDLKNLDNNLILTVGIKIIGYGNKRKKIFVSH